MDLDPDIAMLSKGGLVKTEIPLLVSLKERLTNAFVQKPSIVSTVSQVLFKVFILESFSFVTSLIHYLLVSPKECTVLLH